MPNRLTLLTLLLCVLLTPTVARGGPPGQPGALHVLGKDGVPVGACPLEHTDVKAEISGFLSAVTVTQRFHNPFPDKIEALYTFPLPEHAAVYDMEMKVGKRVIRGLIKPRDEARRIYDEARRSGHVASLLDQERPNVFTQAVANIEPGAAVEITIRYSEVLSYQDGSFSFVFPMVVGPRYVPQQGVPDAGRITPPVTPEGTRAGHDVSLEVRLDAGTRLLDLRSELHEVDTDREEERATVRLANRQTIPNRDFILKYSVAGSEVGDAFLSHGEGGKGHFVLILQPPLRPKASEISPKELVFVVDTSGSMSGAPLEKCKETMEMCLQGVNPQDTFNVITFSGDTHLLFEAPVPATPANIAKARAFLSGARSGGGTEMMKAVEASLAGSKPGHVRIVTFMTDGYVGNDMEIIAAIQKHAGARVFPFGIGQSVNRFLLDGMAAAGRGEVEYVTLNARGEGAARRFFERVRNPVLTDVTVDWAGLAVEEVLPRRIPDLFSSKPVVVYGRYSQPGEGRITLRGRLGGKPWERAVDVRLPRDRAEHAIVGQLWARSRIDDLMNEDWLGIQRGKPEAGMKAEITRLGVAYRLMTQFTSFVAVEEMVVTEGGQARTVAVPVEMPEGVSYEGVYGDDARREKTAMSRGNGYGSVAPAPRPQTTAVDEEKDQPVPAGPEASRVHPSLLAAAAEARKVGWQASFTRDGVKVEKGRVDVLIWLKSGLDAELRRKLEALGVRFAGEAPSGGVAVATVPLEKLEAIGQVEGVRYVDPAR